MDIGDIIVTTPAGRQEAKPLSLRDMFAFSLSVTNVIQSGGLLLLGLFLFAEVGLFLGFFLPGDTLLIAAGIYAKEGKFSIAAVIAVAAVAAIAGDNLAYAIGRHLGRRLFTKENSVIFQKSHVAMAEKFYDRFGARLLLVSHFFPVVRTFTPLLAGVARMPYRRFFAFNAVGDTLWAIVISLVGYYIGSRIPNIDHYILIIILFAVIVSSGPTIYQFVRLTLKKRRQSTK